MEDKRIPMWVHPDFKKLLKKVQNERVRNGKETIDGRVALWRLTKTVSNLVNANGEVFNSLVEVDIDGKSA